MRSARASGDRGRSLAGLLLMIDSAAQGGVASCHFSKIQQGLVGRHSLNEWLQAPQFGIDLSECAVRHQLKPPTEQARLLALGDLHAPALAEPLGTPAATMLCQFARSIG